MRAVNSSSRPQDQSTDWMETLSQTHYVDGGLIKLVSTQLQWAMQKLQPR
jgi:hypothetical protein